LYCIIYTTLLRFVNLRFKKISTFFCARWHCHLLTFPQRRYSVNRCQDPHQLSNQKSQNPSALSASSAVKKICLPSNVVVGGVNLGNLWLSYLWPIFLCLSRRSFCEGGCFLCLFVANYKSVKSVKSVVNFSSKIFEYFQTFLYYFQTFHINFRTFLYSFRTFSNIFNRMLINPRR
jgi:hypothetical protein